MKLRTQILKSKSGANFIARSSRLFSIQKSCRRVGEIVAAFETRKIKIPFVSNFTTIYAQIMAGVVGDVVGHLFEFEITQSQINDAKSECIFAFSFTQCRPNRQLPTRRTTTIAMRSLTRSRASERSLSLRSTSVSRKSKTNQLSEFSNVRFAVQKSDVAAASSVFRNMYSACGPRAHEIDQTLKLTESADVLKILVDFMSCKSGSFELATGEGMALSYRVVAAVDKLEIHRGIDQIGRAFL